MDSIDSDLFEGGFENISLENVVSETAGFLKKYFSDFVTFDIKNLCGDVVVFGNKKQLQKTIISLIVGVQGSFKTREGKISIFLHGVRRVADEAFIVGKVLEGRHVAVSLKRETSSSPCRPKDTFVAIKEGESLNADKVKEGSAFIVYFPRVLL